MPNPPLSRKLALEAVMTTAARVDAGYYLHEKERTDQLSAIEAAAADLGINSKTLRHRISVACMRYGLTVEASLGQTIAEDDDLGDGRATLDLHAPHNAEYITRHRSQMRRIIPVRAEPFGIAVFGDMHADNKGTDLHALKRDLKLCALSGVRAVNIGDTLDNFHYTGKLAAKQAKNRMTDKEGLEVARWIIRDSGVKFDAHILGNHDQWAGSPYAHLFQEWARQATAGPSKFYDWIVRLEYVWEGGCYNLLAAHDFKGNSYQNPLHALMRRAREDGTADGYAAGHRHYAALGSLENGFRGKRYDFCRVGSYKKADGYPRRKGFEEQVGGESAMFVIDPTDEDCRSRVLPSIAEGLEYLQMRRRAAGF